MEREAAKLWNSGWEKTCFLTKNVYHPSRRAKAPRKVCFWHKINFFKKKCVFWHFLYVVWGSLTFHNSKVFFFYWPPFLWNGRLQPPVPQNRFPSALKPRTKFCPLKKTAFFDHFWGTPQKQCFLHFLTKIAFFSIFKKLKKCEKTSKITKNDGFSQILGFFQFLKNARNEQKWEKPWKSCFFTKWAFLWCCKITGQFWCCKITDALSIEMLLYRDIEMSIYIYACIIIIQCIIIIIKMHHKKLCKLFFYKKIIFFSQNFFIKIKKIFCKNFFSKKNFFFSCANFFIKKK